VDQVPIEATLGSNGNTRRISIPGKKALIHQRTGNVLGVVSRDYRVVTNQEAVKLAQEVCEKAFPGLSSVEWEAKRGAAARHFAHQQQRICFIGHSHRPAMLIEGEDRALDITSLESIRPDRKQIINVGSVGQPRDKDPQACYLIYRRERQDVWWRRVAYDVAASQSAIIAAGLPMKFAQRLAMGK
jgi:diadenosine tetraphosphatase ApaH/serine/threonine PP2A family protein phosphatase